jgi:hypothetical protein
MPLLVVMMALTLLTGLGTVLIVGTMTETAVAAAYRQGVEMFYVADAAVEFAIRDLAGRDDWDAVLSGDESSALVDGAPGGPRQVGARMIDLTRATAEVEALLAARAAPPDTPAQLYAWSRFDRLVPAAAARPPAYVCVWVAALTGGEEDDPPVRLLYVAGRAYGATGGQRTVLVTVARPIDPDEPQIVQVRSWEEPR